MKIIRMPVNAIEAVEQAPKVACDVDSGQYFVVRVTATFPPLTFKTCSENT